MSSRENGSSNLRAVQDGIRPSRSHHQLNNKKLVGNYYISSSTLAGTSNLQKAKTFAASSTRNAQLSPKEYKPRQPIKEDTFLWAKGELIGQGSHGRVYLGFNATTGELMAVKQVEVPLTANDRRKAEIMDFVKTLRSERETLMELDHPNIVEYLGFEENPQTVNIFLQYVSGGTISGCLSEYGPFKEDVTKDFTHQILEGIAYLHSKGIIHRDLKSDNILVEPAGVCKISDFGISKKLELDRAYSGFKGTSYWMAPEMIMVERGVGYDSKVDIWSVGCIVFEMWTAKRPWFSQTNFLQVIEKLTRKEAPPFPPDFCLCVLGEHFRKECFDPDPALRPTAEMLLIHPYLQLAPGWMFPGINDMGNKNVVNESPVSELEAVARTLSQAVTIESSKSSSRPSSPAFTMNSNVIVPTRAARQTPRRPPSPPLVIIASPPPRRLPLPQSPDQSVDRTFPTANKSIEGQSQDSGRPQRKLNLHDPKTVPDLSKPKKRDLPKPPIAQPFVYNPPELPPIGADTPYSNSLAPVPKFIPPPPVRKGHHEKQKSSVSFWDHDSSSTLSLPSRMPHRMGPANLKDAMSHSGSSHVRSTDDSSSYTMSSSYSGWQRPPPHSAPAPIQRRPSLPPIPDLKAKAESSSASRRQSAVFAGITRPDNRQVLEHMTVYFPDHDLDEPLVSSPSEPEFAKSEGVDVDIIPERRFTMRSIKSIADEEIHRVASSPSRRRQTRLWGSKIEEIKTYR